MKRGVCLPTRQFIAQRCARQPLSCLRKARTPGRRTRRVGGLAGSADPPLTRLPMLSCGCAIRLRHLRHCPQRQLKLALPIARRRGGPVQRGSSDAPNTPSLRWRRGASDKSSTCGEVLVFRRGGRDGALSREARRTASGARRKRHVPCKQWLGGQRPPVHQLGARKIFNGDAHGLE